VALGGGTFHILEKTNLSSINLVILTGERLQSLNAYTVSDKSST